MRLRRSRRAKNHCRSARLGSTISSPWPAGAFPLAPHHGRHPRYRGGNGSLPRAGAVMGTVMGTGRFARGRDLSPTSGRSQSCVGGSLTLRMESCCSATSVLRSRGLAAGFALESHTMAYRRRGPPRRRTSRRSASSPRRDDARGTADRLAASRRACSGIPALVRRPCFGRSGRSVCEGAARRRSNLGAT